MEWVPLGAGFGRSSYPRGVRVRRQYEFPAGSTPEIWHVQDRFRKDSPCPSYGGRDRAHVQTPPKPGASGLLSEGNRLSLSMCRKALEEISSTMVLSLWNFFTSN